jgi:hypothetical protein
MLAQRDFLLERLAHARAELVDLIPQAPTDRDIYPNWTIKEYLDHLAGWDDAVVEALHAHAKGEPIPQTAARGINAYNAQTVSTRETIDLEHTRREFFASREAVIKAMNDLPDAKFDQPLVFPWGERGTVAYFIEIFVDHDEHDAAHLAQWFKNPDQVIGEH